MKMRILSLLLVPLIAAACSSLSPRERDALALEQHLDFAGEPVDSFSYLGRIDGWRAFGDDTVAVYTGVNDAYLITVAEPCRELGLARNIGLTSTGSTVSARFDHVLVDGQRCQILQIRPVDYGSVKKAAREQAGAKREASARY
jgi:hypothetical protein